MMANPMFSRLFNKPRKLSGRETSIRNIFLLMDLLLSSLGLEDFSWERIAKQSKKNELPQLRLSLELELCTSGLSS